MNVLALAIGSLARWIKCFFGLHDLALERALSRQAALCGCRACGKQFAVKMEGDNLGGILPWEKARSFYETFPGSVCVPVELAKTIATIAHAGQFRRDGVTPYIEHPKAIAARLHREDSDTLATAWLHDVLEDTSETEHTLRASGVSEPVIEAVRLLTKSGEPYVEYLERIKRNDIARKVKIADMLSNLGDAPTTSQVLKYSRGLLLLLDASDIVPANARGLVVCPICDDIILHEDIRCMGTFGGSAEVAASCDKCNRDTLFGYVDVWHAKASNDKDQRHAS